MLREDQDVVDQTAPCQLGDAAIEVCPEDESVVRFVMNHVPDRDRKLLLSRRELDRLFGRSIIAGQTVVPLQMYLKGNWIKLEVALAKGKKLHDKRQAAKERIAREEAEAAMSERR